MATKGFPEFFADGTSAETIRRQFIDRPMEAAQRPALATASELLSLMAAIPRALVRSQQQELSRVKAAGGEDDPRVAQLQASLDQLARLGETATLGESRVQRLSVALSRPGDMFHGFVSDSSFMPAGGLTVRLTRGQDIVYGEPVATKSDGYFLMPLRLEKADSEAGAPPTATVEILDGKCRIVYRDPFECPLDQKRVYREYVIGDGDSQSPLDLKAILDS